MGTDRKEVEKRQKEREKRKKNPNKYGQVKLNHSKKGIASCIYAGISLLLLILLLFQAYTLRENTPGIVGAAGLIDMILAATGIRAAVKGMRERDKRYITCRIGAAVNGIVLLLLILMFLGGF